MNELAWIPPICAEEQIRKGQRAVALEAEMYKEVSEENETYLSTLAAAHADNCDYEKAIEVQSKALELVTDDEERTELTSRLKLFESGKSYHETL